VHSGAFLAHTSDFVGPGGNYIEDGIINFFSLDQFFLQNIS